MTEVAVGARQRRPRPGGGSFCCGCGGMGRVLAALVLLCVLLPCYVWYSELHAVALFPGQGGSPLAVPYQLLNESAPPPAEELAGLRADDDARLMDVVPFRWLLGGGGGGRQPRCAPLVLVLVHSATAHAEHRRLIRDTWGSWGSAGRDVLVRFLVGLPATSEEQATLEEEAAAHGDLVQGNFVDAYRNMTYKHVMALKWFATRCPDATYVLKVDDDVLVNTPVLLDFVWRTLSPFGARRLLACSVLTGSLPKRSYRSKWRVSFKEYSRAMYPRYCAGWAVLYSPDVAMRLYREMQGEPFFWIDDVLVTGLLPERLGITHVSWASLFLKPADLQFVLAGEVRPSFMLALWENVGMDMDDQRVIWRRILDDEIANSSASYVATVSDKERLRQSSPTRVR